MNVNIRYPQGPVTGAGGYATLEWQQWFQNPQFVTLSLGTVLSVDSGGTGIGSYGVGDLLYASATTTLAKLSDIATGNALLSGGIATAPSWGKVGLTTHVTGTLPVANGGTGAATLTGYVKANGTSAFTASATIPTTALSGTLQAAQFPALTGDVTTSAGSLTTTLASVIVAGGPTGSATVTPVITYDAKGRLTAVTTATITPAVGSITGLGTGVATALAVNVGTDGAFVVKAGALGTPASGTLTNCTGLPVGGISGLGTGVATALAVNVGTAGAPVILNGALGSPSSLGTLPAHTLGGAVTGNGQNLTGLGTLSATGTTTLRTTSLRDTTPEANNAYTLGTDALRWGDFRTQVGQCYGAFSKGSGTFDIEHPLLEGKRLRHSFVEGPRYDLIYRGRVTLSNGQATVNLDSDAVSQGSKGMTPGTFVCLTRDPDVFLQNKTGWARVKGSMDGVTLTISAETACSDVVSWMVVAERCDPNVLSSYQCDDNGRLILEYDASELAMNRANKP